MTEPGDTAPQDDPVTAEALAEALAAGEPVRLLDVRNRDEYEAWHVDGPSVEATLVPYMRWLQAEARDGVDALASEFDGDGPVTVVCGTGEASDYVADLLAEVGVDARNLAGGLEAWADVSRTVPVPTAESHSVVQFQRPASGCLGYLVVADGEAVVVDPLRAVTDRYVAAAAERHATITTVVDTHVHADHVSGLRALADAADATPVMPHMAVERGVTYEVETVVDGETIDVGSTTLEAVHLPGHTTGMTAFRVGDVLLAGDSLFLDSVARPDLQQGADGASALAVQLYESLTTRIADLPDDTLVAPDHHSEGTTPAEDGTYTASLGDLRDRLPVFETDRETFTADIIRDMPPRPENFERIIAANLGRLELDDEAAFEVELGPNNCAASPSPSR
jgi:glyoxylase-like metal-dependent hydrolase (beta-lactamase superfamily II)/rhodanese-related sulfurtransferase